MYVFDTSSFIKIFGFYPKRFPSLWRSFEELRTEGKIVSVHEVFKEIKDRSGDITAWAENNKSIFHAPTAEEANFITSLFTVRNGHFQHIIKRENVLKGTPVADPFIIASAKVKSAAVVTEELYKENGSKIPNICKHFEIECLTLEGFMEKEEWEF